MKLNEIKCELVKNNEKHGIFSDDELESLIASVYAKLTKSDVKEFCISEKTNNFEITDEQKKHIKVRYVIEREKRKIRARKEAMKQKNKEV